MVPQPELERRQAKLQASGKSLPARGYARLYREQILQADEGCNFEFLKTLKEIAREDCLMA
jgi:dihydroxy-acid dehydratase